MNEVVKNLREILFRRLLDTDTVVESYELGEIFSNRAELWRDFRQHSEAEFRRLFSGKLFESVLFALCLLENVRIFENLDNGFEIEL